MGLRLLVTRPEPEARQTAQRLEALGHAALLQPLLTFHALNFDASAMAGAKALIITSTQTLRALEEKRALGAAVGLPLFCVGGATAERAKAIGFAAIEAVAETAEALCEVILSRKTPPEPMVQLGGTHKAYDIAGRLAASGVKLKELAVYTMAARSAFDDWLVHDFKRNAIDGVLLLSPRTAEIFMRLCSRHQIEHTLADTTFFCLSAAIAGALGPHPPAKVCISSAPSLAALLDLIGPAAKPEQCR